MVKDRNSFQILLVLCSYQTVFPFAGCVEFLCPSSTRSIFVLCSASCELVLQQNYRLNWGKTQEIQLQRLSCYYRMPFKPTLFIPPALMEIWQTDWRKLCSLC